MPSHIKNPTAIRSLGNKPKKILEFVGRTTTATPGVSIAQMKSPGGHIGPGQTPEFDEYIIVTEGMLRVDTKETSFDVHAGQAFIAHRGEWVQYSTPARDGAEYIAVCVPAFAPEIVHRDPAEST